MTNRGMWLRCAVVAGVLASATVGVAGGASADDADRCPGDDPRADVRLDGERRPVGTRPQAPPVATGALPAQAATLSLTVPLPPTVAPRPAFRPAGAPLPRELVASRREDPESAASPATPPAVLRDLPLAAAGIAILLTALSAISSAQRGKMRRRMRPVP
ncbi:hypothetical protein [Thermoactinospora rubra]|uniref:hypothetical protein n=1 Tax=Thermoactinospora rubra TaxID=1088767 RepID=UPI00117E395B|nr:hypothetical protein [Thermoactinospora rubra]